MIATGVSYIFNRLYRKNFCSFGTLLSFAGLAYYHGTLFHCFSHYQNDLTHINGNVMHHSDFKVDGYNESFVGTLPPGLLYLFVFNYVIVCVIVYGIAKYFKIDARDAPGVSYPYDWVMHAHARLYRTGWFTYGQPSHYALNFAIDYVLIALSALLAYLLVSLTAVVVPKYEENAVANPDKYGKMK
ncbi:unnamed protein product [Sphagnum jensenii]|uniref:Uncharacterized protein n=1 Tax=Sphagnum jensenii TaxID=128206 RepID=A0ABP0V8Q9_9BRYO